jgi:hypothetical protein
LNTVPVLHDQQALNSLIKDKKKKAKLKLTVTKAKKVGEEGMKPYHHQALAEVIYNLLVS